MMELKFSPQTEDYLAAYSAHHRRNFSTWASLGFTVLALFFHILWVLLKTPDQFFKQAGLALAVLLFCMAIAVYAFVISPGRVKRVLQQDPHATAPVEVRIDEQGLHTTTPYSQNENPWANFKQLIDTPKLYMLMGHDRRASFQVLPKRAFANTEDLQKFQALAAEKLGPAPKERINPRNLLGYIFLTLSSVAAALMLLRLLGLVQF